MFAKYVKTNRCTIDSIVVIAKKEMMRNLVLVSRKIFVYESMVSKTSEKLTWYAAEKCTMGCHQPSHHHIRNHGIGLRTKNPPSFDLFTKYVIMYIFNTEVIYNLKRMYVVEIPIHSKQKVER